MTATFNDILDDCRRSKHIVIVGYPTSGKTWLAQRLSKHLRHTLIHTDDYIHHGFKEALYVMKARLKAINQPVIVEGVNGWRLLRSGERDGDFTADLIINTNIGHKCEHDSFMKALVTIRDDYYRMAAAEHRRTREISVNTYSL